MATTELHHEPTTPGPETPDPSDEAALTRDEIFHVLQCRRRRLVLKYLDEYGGNGPARMGDIAEHVAAVEQETTVDRLTSQQRQRVYISLYQSHLKTLDRLGIVDYDRDRGFVERTALAAEFDQFLANEPTLLARTDGGDAQTDSVDAHADRRVSASAPVDPAAGNAAADGNEETDTHWHRRYLYAAAASAVTATAIAGDVVSIPLGPQGGLAVLVSLLFVVLAVTHWNSASSPRRPDSQ
ncbi:DUF7344 domain-containing protein [Haloarcula marina]|uniref:DUF7344 domain-containing protein n=1 Tax=Haloarcula marina TaxID=2961574 RepID=UPI0020B77EFB|nr:hypothetical protein [Halomicroarcula marina]